LAIFFALTWRPEPGCAAGPGQSEFGNGKIHKAVFEVMIQRQTEETSRLIGKDIMNVMENLKVFKKNAKVTFVQTGLTGCDADF
jgi:hypothetical protein